MDSKSLDYSSYMLKPNAEIRHTLLPRRMTALAAITPTARNLQAICGVQGPFKSDMAACEMCALGV